MHNARGNVAFHDTVADTRTDDYHLRHACRQMLRELRTRVLGRPESARPRSRAALCTAASSAKLLRGHGLSISQVSCYGFNVFLSPLDQLFGLTAGVLAKRLAGLASTCLRPLGAGSIARAIEG